MTLRFVCSRTLVVLLTTGGVAARVDAQGVVSAGVGVGGAVGDRHKNAVANGRHGAAYVQLHLPVFPIALRVDALLQKFPDGRYSTAVIADGVYVLPIPLVQPYVLAGYGKYGVGQNGQIAGWNAGGGVRIRTPVITLYVEAHRHQRIERDLLTVGISR